MDVPTLGGVPKDIQTPKYLDPSDIIGSSLEHATDDAKSLKWLTPMTIAVPTPKRAAQQTPCFAAEQIPLPQTPVHAAEQTPTKQTLSCPTKETPDIAAKDEKSSNPMNINVSILRYPGEESFDAAVKKVLSRTLGTALYPVDQRTTVRANEDTLNAAAEGILKRTLEETLKFVTNGSLNGAVEETFDFANDVQTLKRVLEESLERFSKNVFSGATEETLGVIEQTPETRKRMSERVVDAIAKMLNCATTNPAEVTPPTRKRTAEDFPEPDSVKRARMVSELEGAVFLDEDGGGEGLTNSQIIEMQMMAISTLEKENKKLLNLFQSQARKRMRFLSSVVKVKGVQMQENGKFLAEMAQAELDQE